MTDANQLPQAFLQDMKELLGEDYDLYIDSFKEKWKPGLRVNTLKLEPEAFRDMVPWALEPVPWTGNGFYYEEPSDGRERPSKHPWYYAGLYYLQEPSAMTPAAVLPVEPGDRVLDLCAAPGGKSTELAARLKGQGMLVSNDISYSRARALLKNLELTGAPNICVTSEEPEKLAGVWPEFFDKILVDAPCSGEGMFRRDEDMVKDWVDHGPSYYSPIQREILRQAAAMLRPGGLLLYSTCTFSRMEDEETVEYILKEIPELELCPLDLERVPGAARGKGMQEVLRLFPHRVRGEGHFLALLRKKDKGEGKTGFSEKRKGVRLPQEAEDFLKTCSLQWDAGRMMIHKDGSLYYLPEDLRRDLPLRFLRTGLLLGQLKKERFEPSQALAMALKKGEYPRVLDLKREDDRAVRYLKGETISLKEGEDRIKGWCLVSIEGFSLGWAKGSGMSLKNKYYPGWRWQ